MTLTQEIITVAMVVLATMLTRFLPFLVFPEGKPTPKYIVYSLKNVSIFSGSHGIPEFLSIVLVVALHLWKRQMLLSIAGGTVCYMLLVQLVF